MNTKSKVLVFISHAHANREMASYLDRVLRNNGADTFLDQHQVRGGDRLPKKLSEGVERCSHLLLLWSAAASRSRWVDKELDLARDARKRIVPYLLDRTPLPDDLNDRVYVTVDDQQLGNSNLLEAVFGKGFVPTRPDAIFPGRWGMRASAFGLAGGVFELELRPNGQLSGSGRIEGGLFGGVIGALIPTSFPITGSWSHDPHANVLTLDTHTSAMGQSQDDHIEFQVSGTDGRTMTGRDLVGRTYELWRLS